MSDRRDAPCFCKMAVIGASAALAMLALHPTAADAGQLEPTVPDITPLGAVSALTYYTVEPDGFRIVTTLQEDGSDAALPVRMVTLLQAGQKITVSVPGALGMPSTELVFVREGNRLLVHHPLMGMATASQAP